MNLELLTLGGYGQFVWPAFIFTFISCYYLYLKTKEFTSGKKSESATKILEDLGINDTNQVKQIITNLDLRGNRLLLPEVITNMTRLDDKEEVVIRGKRDHLYIKKFNIEK